MAGHASNSQGDSLPDRESREKVARWRRRRPLLIAGGLGASGVGGVGFYLLHAHDVIHWNNPWVPAAAAAWAVVNILTALVVLATRVIRLNHERRAGDLMLRKVETFEQAAKAYDKFRDAREPDGSRGDPPHEERHTDPAVPETDQEALTARQRTPRGRNWTLMRGPVGRADLGTACSQVRWQLPPITSRSPCPSR
jgi:hypothetical protein